MTWRIEESAVGRIVVPDAVPDGLAVFCTSSDFAGRLTADSVTALSRVMRERFGVDAALASCGQVHGASVASATRDGANWSETPSCDAIVAADEGVALAIKIADCLPVSIHDPESARVANVHSGWRGAAARVVPAALEKLSELHRSRFSQLRAWLGPSIRGCCFEVGDEVVEALETSYGDVSPFVDRSRGPRAHVDLSGLTARILVDAGFDASRIDDSEICTRCEGSIFHSYRRDREGAGRNLMVIGTGCGGF